MVKRLTPRRHSPCASAHTLLLAAVCAFCAAACLLPVGSLLAQNEWAAGTAAEATYGIDLKRAWDLQLGLGTELRPVFRSSDESLQAPPTLRNLDFNLALRRRWLERWRLGNALRIRSRYPGSELAAREVRQWFYAERITDAGYVRWSHRLRTEQRWRGETGEPLELSFRHRYRLAAERPLAGLVLDDGEWFFTVGVEVLLSSDKLLSRANSWDVRPTAAVGRGAWQWGLEYRRETALGESARESALLVVLIWDL